MRCVIVVALLLGIVLATAPVAAEDRITYISQPETVAVFLNDIAYVQDHVTLPGDADVQIILPPNIYQDTLIVHENGERLPVYRISRRDGQVVLQWDSSGEAEVRDITLGYLLPGLSWKPTYDMLLAAETDAETVQLDFYAEITNTTLTLDAVNVKLVAGRVDTSQVIDSTSSVTVNQYVAGYDDSTGGVTLNAGAVTIQHVYDAGQISATPSETIYISLLQAELPARRVILWNAPVDLQPTVIYKVRNTSEVPLAEGIVRSYQNNLFIGSDFVETTPLGSEGSITVGGLQDVRVRRAESVSAIDNAPDRFDTQHEVTLTLNNFSDRDIQIDVVDAWPPESSDFQFSLEPVREAGNLFRWQVTLAPGETLVIDYEFKATY